MIKPRESEEIVKLDGGVAIPIKFKTFELQMSRHIFIVTANAGHMYMRGQLDNQDSPG